MSRDHPSISNQRVDGMNKFSVSSCDGARSSSLMRVLASRLTNGQILRNSLAIFSLFVAGIFPSQAMAADTVGAAQSAPISVSLKHFKVVRDASGETKFIDAALALPGDVIEYRATYLNHAARPLAVVATVPVPETMEYLKESARSDKALAHSVATKDEQFASEPLIQKITTSSGATLSQPIPYASYRYVRWDLGKLAPGESVELSVRAKVSQYLEGDVSVEDRASILATSSLKK
jgi:hypothetical protein